jgi:hypothetical protein
MFSATMVPLADALSDFGIFALCISTIPRAATPMPTSANMSPTSFDVIDPAAKDIPGWRRRAGWPPYEVPRLTGPMYPLGPLKPVGPLGPTPIPTPTWGGPHGWAPAGCPVGCIGCAAGLLNGLCCDGKPPALGHSGVLVTGAPLTCRRSAGSLVDRHAAETSLADQCARIPRPFSDLARRAVRWRTMVVDQPQQCVSDLIRSWRGDRRRCCCHSHSGRSLWCPGLGATSDYQAHADERGNEKLVHADFRRRYRGGGVAVKLSTCIHQSLRR